MQHKIGLSINWSLFWDANVDRFNGCDKVHATQSNSGTLSTGRGLRWISRPDKPGAHTPTQRLTSAMRILYTQHWHACASAREHTCAHSHKEHIRTKSTYTHIDISNQYSYMSFWYNRRCLAREKHLARYPPDPTSLFSGLTFFRVALSTMATLLAPRYGRQFRLRSAVHDRWISKRFVEMAWQKM